MNTLTTKVTMYIAMWIKHNRYEKEFAQARDLKDFKRMVIKKLYGNEKPDEKFIKGAKLISWDSLYHALKP